MTEIAAYQHGIYPRSEAVVAATRGLDRGRNTAEEVAARVREDRDDLIAVQREAGLDYFSDGLLRWPDIFRPLVESCSGMEARTLIRWFDNNSFFRAPEVQGSPTLERAVPAVFDDDESLPRPRVATLPSPFLFSRAAQASGDRNSLMFEVAREVIGPVAAALAERGHEVIHLQEPWLAFFGAERGDWDDFEKAVSEIRERVGASARIVLHTYFGDAGPYADRLRQFPVDAVGVDFVETDLQNLGRNWKVGVLAGCLNGRRSVIESKDELVSFGRMVAETLDPPALYLSSNCELEFLPRDVAREKVRRLGEAAAELKEQLR